MDLILKHQNEMITDPDIAYIWQQQSEINELIILDRSMDLITPMLTPLSFEGLIDHYWGIKNSM